jgi:hypothetical protein
MYAITGITGQIGGVIGRALLDARQPARAVMRDAAKGQHWADPRCEVSFAAVEYALSRTERALERTAARRAFAFQMIKTVSLAARRALGGGRSAFSR